MNVRYCVACTLGLLITGAALAEDFAVDWYTIDGGGGFSTGGSFELGGTIGQPDAGVMTGGDFQLAGGFWHGGTAGPPPCPGDVDGDGDTDQSDLGILLADWGCDDATNGCDGDLNGDDMTDQSDLGVLLADWGCGIP